MSFRAGQVWVKKVSLVPAYFYHLSLSVLSDPLTLKPIIRIYACDYVWIIMIEAKQLSFNIIFLLID